MSRVVPKEPPSVAQNTTETARLLVISRESAVLRPLWSISESNSWHVETAANAWDAMERVQSGAVPHLLLLDLPRGDSDCLHVLRWVRRLRPDLPVIVICASEESGRKREATRLGAQEVLLKPLDEHQLEAAIAHHLLPTDDEQPEIGSEYIEQVGPDSFFVCASAISQKLRAQAELLAEADIPVLILGESGSGKDTVARLVHKLSVRSGFQFLKVNCADMPCDLLENELFGGRHGSGKIERAQQGTIFLDEIAEMPMELQAKLMDILQDRTLSKTGSKPISVDVRLLASTSASIDRVLAEKKLREDLYYRLSAFTMQVPSLRQRKSEITVLLQHTMHRVARHYSLPAREFPSSVVQACQHHSWPGNLRELESFVKRYLVSGDAELAFKDLGEELSAPSDATQAVTPASRGNVVQLGNGVKSLKTLIQNVKSEAERNAIGTALQKTGWNRKAAARLLQVSYRTLLYKIDQYHMNSSETFLSPLPPIKLSLQGTATRSGGKE
jgi:two-component system, NtrC family, response regulator AtoC